MATVEFNCFECSAEISVNQEYAGTELICDSCSSRLVVPSVDVDPSAQRESEGASVVLTTAPALEGYKVTETLEIVTAECVYGMDIVSSYFRKATDAFGGRSKTTQNLLRDARKACLKELKAEASRVGADAVIAVDLDYSEFSGTMLLLVASGTAVKVEKLSDQPVI